MNKEFTQRRGYSDAQKVKLLFDSWKLVKYKFKNNCKLANVKFNSFQQITNTIKEIDVGCFKDQILLEIGCGQLLANVKIGSQTFSKVIAIDPELPPQSFVEFGSYFKECGWQRTAKTIFNKIVFMPSFDKRLKKLIGRRNFDFSRVTLFRGNGSSIPIPDNCVDVIISDDVFEHIHDVESVIIEMNRVLRRGGVFCIKIHPYASFSGAHELDGIVHLSVPHSKQRGEPWRHLREKDYSPPVFLNRLRKSEYERAFKLIFPKVACEVLGPEGEDLLTSEIQGQLEAEGFSKEELLAGKLVFFGVK